MSLRKLAGPLVVVAGFAACVAQAQPVPVSEGNTVSASASGGSYLPIFSEDGSTIAFVSHANNLVTNDDAGLTLDVFLAHLPSGATELISENANHSGGGNSDAMHVSVSRYGLYIVFASRASNLASNDANNAVDIFLRSRSGATAPSTRLVSATSQGQSPADPMPFAPRALSTTPQVALFQDRIVFASAATNLVSGLEDTNGVYDVFVRDISGASSAARLVSVGNAFAGAPNGSSHSPQLAGQWIAFISTATDLRLTPPGATNSNRGGDIYLHNTMNGSTHWLSPNTRGLLTGAFPAPPSTYTCFNHAIAEFRPAVVYQATADPNTYPNVLLYCEFGSTNPVRIATESDPVGRPQVSRSGDFVTFSTRSNVYLWNRLTGSNTLISANTNGLPGNGPSHSPVMGPNGDFIAFVSKASDLVEGAPSNRFQIYVYNRVHGTNQLITVNTNGLASIGDFESSNISIAPDNPWLIAFDATAPDLVTNDFNGASDVFMYNLQSSRMRLISGAHNARPARTASPMTGAPSISADGRVVAFTSLDSPFLPDDTNHWQDVFVRDLESGTLRRLSGSRVIETSFAPQAAMHPVVSAAGHHLAYFIEATMAGGSRRLVFRYDLATDSNVLVSTTPTGASPSGFSDKVSVGPDGNLVVFQSTVPVGQFVTNRTDGNLGYDVFARDMISGEMQLISVNYEGTRSGNDISTNAVLSPNGRWVAFESTSTNLTASNSTGGLQNLFVRDLLSNVTEVASIGPNGSAQWGSRSGAAFSGNSRFVAFVGDNYPIIRRDLVLKTSEQVGFGGDHPSLNWDGRFIAYETGFPGRRQIRVTDMQTKLHRLVSAAPSGAEGNGHSTSPLITPDGRFIVFQSLASNLVANDHNNAADIFVADRLFRTILLLTINSAGTGSANGPSSKPVLSADGRKLAFQSLASDLLGGDYNDRRDVFVATLAMPDSDGDGMDDDYEVAHFDNLSRDGSGDFDSDGHTDYEEFIAGTNPTDGQSILRVISISLTPTRDRRLVWSAVPGRYYVIHFKDSFDAPWTLMPGAVPAFSSTASRIDNAPANGRFYRVMVVE